MTPPYRIAALSLFSPVAITPVATAAVMRAGIDGFTELSYADSQGEPVIGAVVTQIPAEVRGRERVATLLGAALDAATERLPGEFALERLPLLLCTREAERPGPQLTGLVTQCEKRIGRTFRRDGSRHFATGSVAAFEAVAHARDLLANGVAEACLLAAVDSLIEARSLDWLERTERLKTAARSDGVIPGEAVGVALMTREPVTATSAGVLGIGLGREPATVLNEEPLLGTGMVAAVRQALTDAGLAMHDVAFRLSDVAGEAYAFEELNLAQTRLTRRPRETQDLWHPAGSLGDCGAATGLVQFVWFEQALSRGYAPGPVALAHGNAPGGARAAAVLGA
jgi:3-oxoacyl-[acyl-carrier-protein] synthase-1